MLAGRMNSSGYAFYGLGYRLAPWLAEDEIHADEAEHICIKMQGLDQ